MTSRVGSGDSHHYATARHTGLVKYPTGIHDVSISNGSHLLSLSAIGSDQSPAHHDVVAVIVLPVNRQHEDTEAG